MKLRNKKTGEVAEVSSCNSASGKIRIYYDKEDGKIGTSDSFSSLAELNEEWEDYEEPKEFWFINDVGEIEAIEADGSEEEQSSKEIGNYFTTKEEAEKALERIKAWDNMQKELDKVKELDRILGREG